MGELSDQIARIIRAGNQAVMTGIELGRKESAVQIRGLEIANARLVRALKGMLDIVNLSHGVSGYHLNGDIAEWDEFPEISIAEQTIKEAGE